MKKALFFISFGLFSACAEIPPVVPPLGDRKVLVEEFTGVRCVNCPAGAAELENLKSIYGDRLLVVSIHTGDFAPPYSDSKYDFRTAEGAALESWLGVPLGYPTAVVNRKKFAGQQSLQVTKANWAGLIAAESQAPSVLNLAIDKKYAKDSRELTVSVTLAPTEKLPDDMRLTVLLTENDVLDAQETPQGKKSDYKHKHILRRIVSGDAKGTDLKGLLTWSSNTKIPNNWVAENCYLVIFVHRSGDTKDVLQVSELKMIE
ncbi:MAG: Omp28-related outer membrane protein [Saprospiraceae bacterium]|nr:Omp28-related outer membrane protein [Saprospiraceae bacterium]